MRVIKNGTTVDEIDTDQRVSTNTKGMLFHVWGGNTPNKTYIHVKNSAKGKREAEIFMMNLYGNIHMNVAASAYMKASEISYQFK